MSRTLISSQTQIYGEKMSFKKIVNELSDDRSRALTDNESKLLKAVLLDAYIEIQEICNKNDLSVMLVGGSLLGAIRHKGYIPWDDDFDIAMPRADFERFKAIFARELGEKYVLDAPNSNIKATDRFPKILIKNTKLVELGMDPNDDRACIKIDLFIIENVPHSKIVRAVHGLTATAAMFIAGQVDTFEEDSPAVRAFFYKSKAGTKVYNRRLRVGKAFSFMSASQWFNVVDRVCRYKRKTDFLGIPTGRKHYFGEILPYDAFLPISEGVFENRIVNLPAKPDVYLKNLFGDYMQIPDEKDREKHLITEIDFGNLDSEKR